MKNETCNFIIIEPFMIDYKLPQTELFCYAIIHSFSKQQQGCFFGTQGYISDQIKTSRQAVNQALLNLANKGLITKRIVSKRLEYTTTPLTDNEGKSVNSSCTLASKNLTDLQPQLTKEGATTVAGIATTVAPYATTVDKGATTVAHIIKDNKLITNLLPKKESKKEAQAVSFDVLIAGYTQNQNLKEALIEFIKMRVLKKKTPTSWALELIFKKLDTLAATDEEKVDILNNSTLNGWQDIYKPKEQQTTDRPAQQKSQSPLEQAVKFFEGENG